MTQCKMETIDGLQLMQGDLRFDTEGQEWEILGFETGRWEGGRIIARKNGHDDKTARQLDPILLNSRIVPLTLSRFSVIFTFEDKDQEFASVTMDYCPSEAQALFYILGKLDEKERRSLVKISLAQDHCGEDGILSWIMDSENIERHPVHGTSMGIKFYFSADTSRVG